MPSSYTSVCWRALSAAGWVQLNSYNKISLNMKEPVEIIIQKHGLTLCHPNNCSHSVFIAKDEKGVGGSIAEFIAEASASTSTVTLFVSEELLFFKVFNLPLDTSNLTEAVGYQLEMATPFADEPTWYSFASVREGGQYKITLYAAQSGYIDAYIQEMIEAGFQLSGLYPENQRYVNRLNRKSKWGLLLPGRFFKAYIFNGITLEDRLLCSSEPSFAEAVEVCGTDKIYRFSDSCGDLSETPEEPGQEPYFDYLDARLLVEHRPLLKSYNMLPASYQSPDYLKIIVGVLLVLNVVTFLTLGGVKAYKLKVYNDQVDNAIEAIMPKVNEVNKLRLKKEKMLKAINQMDTIGQNFDLIGFLTKMTQVMPASSYVDQLRLDKKTNTIEIRGYTEDVGALTDKLQDIGDARLKSTSRRKNKTYFNVEMSIP